MLVENPYLSLSVSMDRITGFDWPNRREQSSGRSFMHIQPDLIWNLLRPH